MTPTPTSNRDPAAPARPHADPPDPLIDEVRAIRRDLSLRFGNDVERLAEHVRHVGDAHRRAAAPPPAATDLPMIRKTPGVCGGHACVRDTRVPVWTLYRLRELGRTDPELLDDYPTLTPADLAVAWDYAGRQPEEIRDAIRRQGQGPTAGREG